MEIIKEGRLTLDQLLDRVDKDDFQREYHTSSNTLSDLAQIFNISVTYVTKLINYWGLSWSADEIRERKQIASRKYDMKAATSKRTAENIKRYGSANPRAVLHPDTYHYDDEKSRIADEKRRNTTRSRYNVDHYSQTQDWRDRAIPALASTNMDRYGVRSYAQTPEFHKNARKRYMYKGEKFDSSWELYYYVYMLEHGHNIVRNTQLFYQYEYMGNSYRYFPDFIVDGKVVEIKGDYLVDADNHLKKVHAIDNPDKLKAKDDCMVKNNVKLILKDEILPIINEVQLKYGKDFHKAYMIS